MCHLLNFQKILMVRHVTNKNIVNMKQRNFNKFFKQLIKGNIKYLRVSQIKRESKKNKLKLKYEKWFQEKILP